MAWDNCRKCMFIPRSTHTSSLFKVLLTLKLLHGTRTGAKGSTLEDIAMHMIKYFGLDGDIKSQVLATLKYAVKMNFIQRKKEKFSLILPATAIHLVPCKQKNEEIERIQCIFPPKWKNNAGGNTCTEGGGPCGARKTAVPNLCCQGSDDEESSADPCKLCREAKKSQSKQSNCSHCFPTQRKRKPPCPKAQPRVCAHKKSKQSSCSKSALDDLCQMCDYEDDEQVCDSSDPCNTCKRSKRKRSCSRRSIPTNPCRKSRIPTKRKQICVECFPPAKSKRKRKSSCPQPKRPKCARKTSKRSVCPKSPYDDFCQMCDYEDSEDDNGWKHGAFKNCSCCPK